MVVVRWRQSASSRPLPMKRARERVDVMQGLTIEDVTVGIHASNGILVDYHNHLERGPFSLDWLRRFVDTAISRGVAEIGFSEHGHRFKNFAPIMEHLGKGEGAYPAIGQWLSGDFRNDVKDYVELVSRAKESGLPVKLGVEVDFIPGCEEAIQKWIADWPWDYVIGSVHFIGKWCFDYRAEMGWPERSVDRAYADYFGVVSQAAASGLFDIIGHLDVIKVHGHRPADGGAALRAAREALLKIKEAGCCIEINTAGWRKPVAEIYPAPELLRLAADLSVPITFGSDAHEPEEAGYLLTQAVDLARATGYTRLVRFEDRQFQEVSIV